MSEHFDIASQTYDKDFTDTSTGRLQRDLVWKHLAQRISLGRPLHILELNCGTGEDAVYLAKSGHVITATDISDEMLTRAKEKITHQNIGHQVRLEKADLKQINLNNWSQQFDIVFSNFGGVNCIGQQDLEKFKAEIQKVLKPQGTLIFVIMPELCLWESLYFLGKLRFKDVFRRKKASVMADVSGVKVETWYYSPRRLSKVFTPDFIRIKTRPIGFFGPPSYMENFVKKHPRFFQIISFMEHHFSRFSWQSSMADHYYIELQAK